MDGRDRHTEETFSALTEDMRTSYYYASIVYYYYYTRLWRKPSSLDSKRRASINFFPSFEVASSMYEYVGVSTALVAPRSSNIEEEEERAGLRG